MSTFRHSSLLPKGSPLPKTINGRTRADDRDAAQRAIEAERKRIYALVDARDGGHCRLCGIPIDVRAQRLSRRVEHHHIVKRSQGGPDTTQNVIRVCRGCHELIHVKDLLSVTGDADARDAIGNWCGLILMRRNRETGVWEPGGVR